MGRWTIQVQAGRRPQSGNQLVVDDLYHLLGRSDAPHYLVPNGSLAHSANEVFDDLEVHIGFQQGQPNLTQGRIHVGFAQFATTGDLPKNALQSVL
jgi:hypothetical protein